jgi:transcriptional regulator with XRE-family HTH domain
LDAREIPKKMREKRDEPLIKRIRRQIGLTQREMADAVGRSFPSIRVYEAGTKPTPLHVFYALAALCRATDPPLEDLALECDALVLTQDKKASSIDDGKRQTLAYRYLDHILKEGSAGLIDAVMQVLEMSSNKTNGDREFRRVQRAMLADKLRQVKKTGRA